MFPSISIFFLIIIYILGEHTDTAVARKCRRVQLRARVRVLQPQVAHVPGVWDAGAEPLRLPQAEQVLAPAPQVHQADIAASADCAGEAQGGIFKK